MADDRSSWKNRIPFILLFGITTSIDLFQEKLSRATIRSLQGARFDMEQLTPNEILKAVVSLDQSRSPWLGPGLSSTIIRRHYDYVQSTSSFVEAIKVNCTISLSNSKLKSCSMLTWHISSSTP